jgi:Cu-Zn family superoxide dismutase
MMRAAALLCFALLVSLLGCDRPDGDPLTEEEEARPEGDVTAEREEGGASRMPEAEHRMASARIQAKSGSNLSGEASLTEGDDDVTIVVRLENASPGSHAVHVHEGGDCSAPDASGAGGHWNPTGEPHGKRGSSAFHAGDLGNIDVGSDGRGSLTVVAEDWSLGSADGENHPVGKAIVVHAQADDFATQPDGGSGEKIGCGVIESTGTTRAP